LRKLGDATSQFIAEGIPELSKEMQTPNVNMRGRKERDQSQMLVKDHIGITVDCNAATPIEFQGQMTKLFHHHLQMIQQGEIVMPDAI
jgi:hypothetical protein